MCVHGTREVFLERDDRFLEGQAEVSRERGASECANHAQRVYASLSWHADEVTADEDSDQGGWRVLRYTRVCNHLVYP